MLTGNKKKIEERHTLSGVKDSVADRWHDRLVKQRAEIRIGNPDFTDGQITAELRRWLQLQPGEKMNPLLSVPGKSAEGS